MVIKIKQECTYKIQLKMNNKNENKITSEITINEDEIKE